MNASLARAASAFRWPSWRHLPRDARDTLFLLAVIAWTVLPHLRSLPVWCGVLTGAVLLWRGHIALRNGSLPPRWLVVCVLVLVGVLTWASHSTLIGKEAGVTLVVAMMALKTLELRARRDAFVVFFLGFFIVLTQFLSSQSLLVAAAMLVSVWGLLTALVLAHMPVGQPSLRQAATLSARAALLGAPVMVLLFLLFPRINPLWGVPQDAGARTGLSGRMTMGSVAEMALDDSIALRLRFEGPPPAPKDMYLRGPVLSRFDGREWRRSEFGYGPSGRLRSELQVSGPVLRYEMTVEPMRIDNLPLLEATPDTPEGAPRIDGMRLFRRDDLQWQTDRPISERLRFSAAAHLQFRHGPRSEVPALRDHLQLPPGFNPRTLAWAAALRADPRHAQDDTAGLVRAVLQHITSGGYSYTLEPGTYGDEQGRHAIDEFWLDRKQGFCEHFAAAFVVVMRAQGIPARIVTGYQGSDSELSDGYVIVRNSYAHAWAEYWQPGAGWVRADPTSAIAPERIGLSRNLLPQPGFVAGAIATLSPDLLARLRGGWEATNNRWNQWVLSYSRGQQLDLLKRLGFESPSWQDLGYLLILLVSAAGLLGAGWAWWDRQRQDPWQRLTQQVRQTLAGLGVPVAAHDPLRTLARASRAALGPRAEGVAALLEALDREHYGRDAGGAASRGNAGPLPSFLDPLGGRVAARRRPWGRSWRPWRRRFRAEVRGLAHKGGAG